MRASLLPAALILAQAGHFAGAQAPIVTTNPAGVVYRATLAGSVTGSITATAGITGRGVVFLVEFEGLPATGGPFPYHIHVNQVPADGNCTATGGHLNPYNAPATCDPANRAACEVGDLSGKYGDAEGINFSAAYVDDFTSTNQSDPAFFGTRSFVIHLNDLTRIACANFELVEPALHGGAADCSPDPPASPASPSDGLPTITTAPAPSYPTNTFGLTTSGDMGLTAPAPGATASASIPPAVRAGAQRAAGLSVRAAVLGLATGVIGWML